MCNKKGNKWLRGCLITAAVILGLWLFLEIGLRIYVEMPLKTDFYSSIPRDMVQQRQKETGVRVVQGPRWVHLGWIADPEKETYRVDILSTGSWQKVGASEYGSCLLRQAGGSFRVMALSKGSGAERLIGTVDVKEQPASSPLLFKPVIAGKWQTLFRPHQYGYYINDHAIYQDASGQWRLVGITSRTNGDFNAERYFAVGVSDDMPPESGMQESTPVADFGELAWAPDVITENGTYYMFRSPHRLERMTSPDGITWGKPETVIPAPYHKFFRDGMVLKAAEGQWLLYTTARGLFFSQVDRYQSFDLKEWQYTGTALQTGWGSERNSPFASTESPFVMQYKGHYYLSITYNNDTFFWNGLLLPLKIWFDRPSYNDTLVFHADNPYDFGMYNGVGNAPTLSARLTAHAPKYIYVPDKDAWYITTAGWPWITSLTSGEAAIATLKWEPVP